jgi:hypothetical protein
VDEMMGDQGGKGHTFQKRSNKLKKSGGYLINWENQGTGPSKE